MQAVFDAWTSEEVIRRCWRAEHDWRRPRSRSTCAWAVSCAIQTKDVEYGGGYAEVEPPTRLAYTCIWNGDATRP
ncbi:MAG: SRPBCC domain-containing protein [Thermoleophilaceae bacterium]